MLAMVAQGYGPPEVMELTRVPRPVAGPGEVLVRVAAAGTNPVDVVSRAGFIPDWFGPPPHVWGWDVSGTVEQAGPGVVRFAPGDEVFGMPGFPKIANGYAEYVVAPAHELAAKPKAISHAAAAALPLCGLTALQTLDRLDVAAGQRVLVNGAAGGVGHLAVQLARALGAHVIGVSRTRNHEFLRDLGANEVVDYQQVRVADAVRGADVVVDCAGDDSLVASLRRGGVFARVPGAANGPGPLEEAAKAAGVRVVRHVVHPDGHGLARLARAVDDGVLTPAVTTTLPLAQAARAHELLDGGHSRGKIVLTVTDPE